MKQAVLPLDSLALHKSCLRAPSSGSGDRDGDSDDESSSGGGGGDTWNCVVRLSCPVPAAGSEKQQKQRETGASQLTKSLLDMLARSSSTGSAAAWAGAQFGVADARQDVSFSHTVSHSGPDRTHERALCTGGSAAAVPATWSGPGHCA